MQRGLNNQSQCLNIMRQIRDIDHDSDDTRTGVRKLTENHITAATSQQTLLMQTIYYPEVDWTRARVIWRHRCELGVPTGGRADLGVPFRGERARVFYSLHRVTWDHTSIPVKWHLIPFNGCSRCTSMTQTYRLTTLR